MTDIGREKMSFDMGRVVDRTFGVLSANIGVFAVLGLLLSVLPEAGLAWVQTRYLTPDPANPTGLYMTGTFWLFTLGSALVGIILQCLMQASVIHTAVADLKGRSAGTGEALSVAFANLVPLFLLALLMALGIFAGLILLIVPGIFLAVAWMVAVPAMVVEKKSVVESLERSWRLTENNRWWLVLITLVFLLGVWFVSAVVVGIGIAVLGAVTGGFEQAAAWATIIIAPIITAVSAVIGSVGVAAIYFELRSIKEGVGVDDLARVFE